MTVSVHGLIICSPGLMTYLNRPKVCKIPILLVGSWQIGLLQQQQIHGQNIFNEPEQLPQHSRQLSQQVVTCSSGRPYSCSTDLYSSFWCILFELCLQQAIKLDNEINHPVLNSCYNNYKHPLNIFIHSALKTYQILDRQVEIRIIINIQLFVNNFQQIDPTMQGNDKGSVNSGMNSALSPNSLAANSKADRLKQIDALYRSQIKQIYNESKEVAKQKQAELKRDKSPPMNFGVAMKKTGSNQNFKDQPVKYQPTKQYKQQARTVYKSPEAQSRIGSKMQSSTLGLSSDRKSDDDKIRASVYLQGESTRTIQILRKQNQIKQLKIRQLSSKCQNLVERLKSHLSENDFKQQLESLKQFSDSKMERLENLFKIKNQEIFFKMKLQIIGLLQEFQISKQQISGINEVNSESQLYSFMVRKLKLKLKDFRSKEQENNFEIQKDKILNQKYEERIHYLTQTNELLKLSQTKLKSKIEDLRAQMNQFLDKLKGKQKQIQQRQSQIFRLKKQSEELQSTNQKLNHAQRNITSERNDDKRIYEAKQKQMKALLSSYFLQRKKLEGMLEQKQGELEEIKIRQKFLQQENERINREYVRWKQRYEWLERQKQNRQRQYEEEKAQLISEFVEYKNENNQGVYMTCKAQTDEANRKVEEYQTVYQKIIGQLQEERRIRALKQQQSQNQYEISQREWLEKIKRIEKMKQQEMYELAADHENRQKQIRDEYQKRQQLLSEQMQARMKALLAENDKKSTERLIQIQNENDQLRKQIENLSKIIQVKESLINVMNIRKTQNQ